jgi:SEC-C motif-containing protein
MSRAQYPLDAVEGLLKKGRFVNEEQVQETFAGLMELWNTTARPELDGRTPREVSRLAPIGPLERQLAGQFAESIRCEGLPERFRHDRKRRRAAIAARQQEWMNTPREDFGGLAPSELIAAERADSMESALRPGDALPVYKVSRNAPCPCGSGKRYKRCCLPRQH